MGNTMKRDEKSNSTAKFAVAVSHVLTMIERNCYKSNDKPTIIQITVKGETEETEEFEIENLNEIIQILKMNDD